VSLPREVVVSGSYITAGIGVTFLANGPHHRARAVLISLGLHKYM
jgi:hypothetical protein